MQFFPLLNHQVLLSILDKASFDLKVLIFFWNYLISRKTKYLWNSFSSPFFNVGIGVGQRSALLPILSALYFLSIFHIFEKHLKILKILIFILSFIDNRLLISQDKSILVFNANLFCSYNVISNLLIKFGLIMEYRKTEVFHFSRLQGIFDLPPLNLIPLKESILWPKTTWYYLRFIFNQKLLFCQHIDFYTNKAISTIKCMKILGNSSRGFNPMQKRCLYRYCTLPIALYSFQMWYYNKVPLVYPLKKLRKIQKRVTI